MSIFNEFLCKGYDISKTSAKNIEDELKAALECLCKFEEEYYGRGIAREKAPKDKTLMTTLQSINEDDVDQTKTPEAYKNLSNEKPPQSDDEGAKSSSQNNKGNKRVSTKRSKDEVEGMSSPEQDKRQKRNASVKAQGIISKQVNVNLTQKLRREDPSDKSRSRRNKDDNKENTLPLPVVNIKLEKISLPAETMDTESASLDIQVKQELNKDDIVMPPPVAPVPKSRKGVQKDKSEESSEDELGTGKRRTTRTKKQTDPMPPPPVPSARSTRASSRASSRSTKQTETEVKSAGVDEQPPPPPEPRPKRTRAKKKVSTASSNESVKDLAVPQENGIGSPTEKPRPKRTRRAQKAIEKESQKAEEPTPEPELISPKDEKISEPHIQSPLLQKNLKTQKAKKTQKEDSKDQKNAKSKSKKQNTHISDYVDETIVLEETKVLNVDKLDGTVTICNDMDKTVVLPTATYNHAPITPKSICNGNETVILEVNRETIILENHPTIMNATVVIEKEVIKTNMTNDDSLLTDDSEDFHTPPKQPPVQQPTSAVKEKVQKFEELAARTTRTKTRAMAKMQEDEDNHTPPDKMIKPVLSAETLNKMNNLIFNGKATQMSSSASKPRVVLTKPAQSASTSKLSALARQKEEKEKEDAIKKKEALLGAKREQQRKRREDKMAAAAAVRGAAERERRLAMEAAARERKEKQAHVDLGKLEKLKEVERKKLELARKVAETEERRRAEEAARHQRLADEQRRADLARAKQREEAEANKKEAAIMAKEIEKKQKEYMEKQKLKNRKENMHTPLQTPGTPGYCPQEPVHMADGFQYLKSDEEDDQVQRPVPAWSSTKARQAFLSVQSQVNPALIDKLFSVRVHSPDLREIFPNIERARLKRTSSAVWRTPPRANPLPAVPE